ncbi:MAG: aminopeptidase, partial [SAR324 cluster bacterium]|nr:aminopeptidase [SAR324 cluster bacterium]
MSSCSELGYYWQAASGHLELLNRKQDIQELLESPETSAELKRKLKLVESVRTFASGLMGLQDDTAY